MGGGGGGRKANTVPFSPPDCPLVPFTNQFYMHFKESFALILFIGGKNSRKFSKKSLFFDWKLQKKATFLFFDQLNLCLIY